jgi:hypothetical protein
MRIRLNFVTAVVCMTAALLATASPATDVKTLAAAVDEHYNHLHSLQAQFTELYRGSGIERTRQDALGVPFSQRETVCERRKRRVVLRAR